MVIQHSVLDMVLSALIMNHLVFSITLKETYHHYLNLTKEETGTDDCLRKKKQSFSVITAEHKKRHRASNQKDQRAPSPGHHK